MWPRGIRESLGGAADKILDETFDTDFSAFSAPHASWGINTDLADFSIVGGVGRIGSTSDRGIVFDSETVQNSLQIATVRMGTANSNNRFFLMSRVIAGEKTALSVYWTAHTSGSNGWRAFAFDDGSQSAAIDAATYLGAVGSYYSISMLTIGEMMFAMVHLLDSTDKDLRGEWVNTATAPPIPDAQTTGITDANTGWPAEANAGQAGGGFMLGSTGAQNTGANPAELLRWEIWDLGL